MQRKWLKGLFAVSLLFNVLFIAHATGQFLAFHRGILPPPPPFFIEAMRDLSPQGREQVERFLEEVKHHMDQMPQQREHLRLELATIIRNPQLDQDALAMHLKRSHDTAINQFFEHMQPKLVAMIAALSHEDRIRMADRLMEPDK